MTERGIQFWRQKGLLPPLEREAGQEFYTRAHLTEARRIAALRSLNVPLAEIVPERFPPEAFADVRSFYECVQVARSLLAAHAPAVVYADGQSLSVQVMPGVSLTVPADTPPEQIARAVRALRRELRQEPEAPSATLPGAMPEPSAMPSAPPELEDDGVEIAFYYPRERAPSAKGCTPRGPRNRHPQEGKP